MKPSPEVSWPPSIEALGPPLHQPHDPYDPIQVMRVQHHEMVRRLLEISATLDSPPADSAREGTWLADLRAGIDGFGRFVENHRDMEESNAFPVLHAARAEFGSALDDLGDEHVRIFEIIRRLDLQIDRARAQRPPESGAREGVRSAIRAFLELMWRHTLTEEALVHDLRGGAPTAS